MPAAEAAFVMSGPLMGGQTPESECVTDAMFAVLQQAQAEGLTDPAKIKARILAAADSAIGG